MPTNNGDAFYRGVSRAVRERFETRRAQVRLRPYTIGSSTASGASAPIAPEPKQASLDLLASLNALNEAERHHSSKFYMGIARAAIYALHDIAAAIRERK